MEKDYYKILGVDKNASEQDIRKAFLKLSKKYHPDMQSGKTEQEKKEAEEKFKEINEANEILSNKEKREYYDNFGTVNQGSGFGAGGIDPREFFRRYHQGGFGMPGFDDDFGFNPFGRTHNSPPNPNAPKNGRHVEIQIKINLEDVLYGSNKDLEINVSDPCPNCHGTGAENGEMVKCPDCNGSGMKTTIRGNTIMQSTCPTCRGRGYSKKNKCPHCDNGFINSVRKVNVNIPKGLDEGCVLRIRGEGEKGINGGQNGDIRIIVTTAKHNLYERIKSNLVMDIYISPITSIIGGDIEVQTPWGLAKLNIPKGTEDGTTFRLKEQGIHKTDSKGDLYVNVFIETIKNCTEEQERIIKELEKILTNNNLEKITKQKELFKEFYKTHKEKIKENNV